MIRNLVTVFCACSALAACCSTKPPCIAPPVTKPVVPVLDSKVYQDCESWGKLASGDEEVVVTYVLDLQTKLNTCSELNKIKLQVIKEAFGQPKPTTSSEK